MPVTTSIITWPTGALEIIIKGLPPGCYEIEKVAGAPWSTLRLVRTAFNMERPATVPQGRPGIVSPPEENPMAKLGRQAAERVDAAVWAMLEGTPPDIANAIDRGPAAVPGPWNAYRQTGAPCVAVGNITFPAPCGPVPAGTRGRVMSISSFNQDGQPGSYRVKFEGHDGPRNVGFSQIRILDWPGEVPPAVPIELVRAIVNRAMDDAVDIGWEITDDDLKGAQDVLAEWVRHGRIIDNRSKPTGDVVLDIPRFCCDVCGSEFGVATIEDGGRPTTWDCAGCPNTYVLEMEPKPRWQVQAMQTPGIDRPNPSDFNVKGAE